MIFAWFLGIILVIFVVTLIADSMGFNGDNPHDPRSEGEKVGF